MKTLKSLCLLILALVSLNCTDTKVKKNEKAEVALVSNESSLYERLGKAEGISALVDDIVEAHLVNPLIKDKFQSLKEDPKRFEVFKNHVKAFLAAGTGGTEKYTGRDMTSAHAGLKINEKEFLAAVDDIMTVLGNHKIDVETTKDMLYILYSLKGAVMEK